MVIKTDPCAFSEYKIFPGRGSKFVAKDGKVFYFISKKTLSLYLHKKKAVKLTWTQAWRRFNKKLKVDDIAKRRTKKTVKVQKAIVGMSLEEIRRRRAENEGERDKKLDQAKKEVKDRQKKKIEAKKSDKVKSKVQAKAPVVKSQPAQKQAKQAKAKGGK